MSQMTTSDAVATPQDEGPSPYAKLEEFGYRPVPVLAPVSLLLGLLSALGFVGIVVAPLGLIGIVVSLLCIVRLRKFRGEYGGMWLAVTGLVLSFVFFTTSAGLWAYTYTTEVPPDYRRLNFNDDISKKGFVKADGGKAIDFHQDVKQLDGKKIFLKGYMYPTKKTNGLSSFLLVKDNAQCCFGGNPAITDMILIDLENGKKADFRQGILMSVAGVFHCKPASGPAGLMPVYSIDSASVESARTLF
jgi:hypothetical protein